MGCAFGALSYPSPKVRVCLGGLVFLCSCKIVILDVLEFIHMFSGVCSYGWLLRTVHNLCCRYTYVHNISSCNDLFAFNLLSCFSIFLDYLGHANMSFF